MRSLEVVEPVDVDMRVKTMLRSASVLGADRCCACPRCVSSAYCERRELVMTRRTNQILVALFVIVAAVVSNLSAVPPTADESINKDRVSRQSALKTEKNIAVTPKWGFFGTIFRLILEQVNDTKSAYNQVSDLVNSQFSDGNTPTAAPDPSKNGTTAAPKITRAEFLNILDRNLKGLARLRSIEWRESKKASMANLKRYKEEIFRGKS